MNPENGTRHFPIIMGLIEKHNITKGTKVLNLDECRFSIRGMTLGRSKCVLQKETSANMTDQKF